MTRILTYGALVVASVITIFAMLKASAGTVDLGVVGFLLFALSPYITFAILVTLIARFARVRHIWEIALAISVLMLGFTAYIYLLGMDGTSSTEGLAFVFVPVYIHIGSLLGLAVSIVVSKLASPKLV